MEYWNKEKANNLYDSLDELYNEVYKEQCAIDDLDFDDDDLIDELLAFENTYDVFDVDYRTEENIRADLQDLQKYISYYKNIKGDFEEDDEALSQINHIINEMQKLYNSEALENIVKGIIDIQGYIKENYLDTKGWMIDDGD